MLVVAVSSVDRAGSRCWSGDDVGRVVHVLNHVLSTLLSSKNVPLFALGASSGGAFVASLPPRLPPPLRLSALVVQIMAANLEPEAARSYPPSLWIHMPRDARMAAGVAESLRVLRNASRVVEEIRVEPLPLGSFYFSHRIAGFPPNASIAVFTALRGAGLINDAGFLVDDPRRTEWRAALWDRGLNASQLGGDTLAPDASPIAEELNVAWAGHEITADWSATFFLVPTPPTSRLTHAVAVNATIAFFLRAAAAESTPV